MEFNVRTSDFNVGIGEFNVRIAEFNVIIGDYNVIIAGLNKKDGHIFINPANSVIKIEKLSRKIPF